MKPFVTKQARTPEESVQCDASRAKESHLSFAILNRSGRLALLVAVALVNLASAAVAADAPTPTIEHTGNWRKAVESFVAANM